MAETKEFKAESKRLLEMMINSIYTHKEIFLRTLIIEIGPETNFCASAWSLRLNPSNLGISSITGVFPTSISSLMSCIVTTTYLKSNACVSCANIGSPSRNMYSTQSGSSCIFITVRKSSSTYFTPVSASAWIYRHISSGEVPSAIGSVQRLLSIITVFISL